ncbi:MAG: DNA topoisomerase VI subunit B, partial [Pseudobdellovibrionaceae bacterium]
SKETIDASEELVAEIRLALIQAGQKLSRHIKKESKEADLERKLAHIEQFGPILVESLARIVGANEARKKKAEEGLKKLLGRDSQEAIADLEEAEGKLLAQKKRDRKKGVGHDEEEEVDVISSEDLVVGAQSEGPPQGTVKAAATKKMSTKKGGK